LFYEVIFFFSAFLKGLHTSSFYSSVRIQPKKCFTAFPYAMVEASLQFFFSFFFAILFPSFSLFLSLSSALVEHSHHVKVEIYVTSIHIHLGLFLPLWWSWKFASWSLWKRSLQPARATIDMFMKRFALVLWSYYFIFGFCSFFCKILCFLFRYLSLTESFSMLNKFEVWKLYLSPLQYLLSPNGFLIYIYFMPKAHYTYCRFPWVVDICFF